MLAGAHSNLGAIEKPVGSATAKLAKASTVRLSIREHASVSSTGLNTSRDMAVDSLSRFELPSSEKRKNG